MIIAWVTITLLTGYYAAHAINLAELWLSRAGLFIPFAVSFLLLVFLLKVIAIRKGKQLLHQVHTLFHFLKIKITQNRRFKLLAKNHPTLVLFINNRIDKSVFNGRPLSILMIALLYIMALFAGIIEDFITADVIVMADIRIANLFTLFRNETLTSFFTWITLLGKLEIISIVLVISAALLYLWNKKHFIIPFFISALGSLAFTWSGKLAFQRARPEYAIYLENSYSFPSGHAAIAVAIYGFIGYLLIRSVTEWPHKVNIFVVTIAVVLLIGFSRVYLGVHYISDIWCGYLVGAIWLIIGITLSEWLKTITSSQRVRLSPGKLISATCFLLSVVILFYYLFAMICSVALFASCSDDDDEVTGLTIDQVVGTFTGQLEVLNQSIPGTSIFVTKVDANTVKVELKDFKFSGLTIGDISAECKVALDREGDDFDLNGQATLTVAALGNIELPISITGEVDAKELDIDINITNVPALNTLKVEFEGTK